MARFYVNFIEMTSNGENRTQPKAYDTKDEAMAYFHKAAGTDIASEQVLGYNAIVWHIDSANNCILDTVDTWGTMESTTETA